MAVFQRKTRRYFDAEYEEPTSFSMNVKGDRNLSNRNMGKRDADKGDDRSGEPRAKFSRGNDRNFKRNGFNRREEAGEGEVKKKQTEEEGTKTDKEEPEQKKTAKEYYKDAKLKQFRMIVRNLPFKTTREDLQNICSNFGPFSEIVVPPSKKMEGRCAGFCFIQFKTREAADKAREYFNNNKFLGRMVAADWALDKDTYETNAHEEKKNLKSTVKEEKDDKKKNEAEESDEETDSDEGEVVEEEEKEDKKKTKPAPEKKQTRLDTAIEEERVVFLRNLSFETTEDALKEEVSKFGTIELAVICKFKDSGHSKGTAFVHFSTKDEAVKAVEAAENQEFVIDGRTINAIPAIPREKAGEIEKEAHKKVPSDNRNLRLLRFSLIREGTSAAAGMSQEDAAKRQRLAEVTRKKLENLHMFVSPLRLVVHNLPPKMTDAKLREICKEAGGAGAFVNECRIWKDTERLNAKGEPKSKGFAFVAFKEHTHALACLQKLNNNAKTFINEKRPIVEFSIENISALQAKERRMAKSKGEKVNPKQLNEKVRKQVQESIGKIHMSGMKVLPKFLGKKMRHRNMSKNKKKKLGLIKKDKNTGQTEAPKKKKSAKKTLTKYLALSS